MLGRLTHRVSRMPCVSEGSGSASTGIWVIWMRLLRTATPVRASTRSLCAALNRMTRRTMSAATAAACDRRAQAGFRVEQEIRGDDHPLAGGEAPPYLVSAGQAGAQRDLARLVVPVTLVDENQRALAGRDDRGLRHGERGRRGALQRHVDEHVRLHHAAGVGDVDARFALAVVE